MIINQLFDLLIFTTGRRLFYCFTNPLNQQSENYVPGLPWDNTNAVHHHFQCVGTHAFFGHDPSLSGLHFDRL